MRNDILDAFQGLVDRWYFRYAESWIVDMIRGLYDPPRAIAPLPCEKADLEKIVAELETILARYPDRMRALKEIRSIYDPLYRKPLYGEPPLRERARNRLFNRIRKEHEQGMGTNMWPLIQTALNQRE